MEGQVRWPGRGAGQWIAGGLLIAALAGAGGWWLGRCGRCSLSSKKAVPARRPRPAATKAAETVESREARLAALALAGQNEALRREASALGKQVRRLAEALAAVRIEADGYRARLDQGGWPAEPPAAGDLAGEWKVLKADPELRMVILDGGAQRGLRSGMQMFVLREERPVARLIVVDARAGVAGAVVEERRDGIEPAAGDRVIPARPGMSLR